MITSAGAVLAAALRKGENLALVLTLGAMAVLPPVEAVLRASLGTGISGAALFTQNLTLMAAMLGSAIAARERRLLSLSTLSSLLKGSTAVTARFFSSSVAAAVAMLLAAAGVAFVLADSRGGNTIAYGIPVWLSQAVLPLGFVLIAVRLAYSAADRWHWRACALGLAAFTAWAATGLDARLPHGIVAAMLCALAAAAALGAPVFVLLGGAALVLFMGDGLPIASISIDHYRLAVNPSLPMIPLFTLAGYFLSESGAPARLVRVFNALFAGMRGGAAVVTVAACAFFTSFSGASGVTILALGGMLLPLLVNSGYSPKNALGLVTSAGSLGGLLPPGLPLVLYAIVAKISIEDMFLAGVLPALLLTGLIALWGARLEPRTPRLRRFDPAEARAALWAAKWELLLPVVAFTGLFGGMATPIEAAAVTALYAFIVAVFIHRDLSLARDVPRVMVDCGLLVGGVMLILGVALGFTNYLVDADIPGRAAEWLKSAMDSRWVFLLALNAFLLIAGCVMDIFSATVVLVPLIVPVALAFGIDPLHLGIIFLVNMELGYLTPPVGMNLFFSSYRFGRPLPEVCRAILAPFAVLAAGVLLITYAPGLSTTLPRMLR